MIDNLIMTGEFHGYAWAAERTGCHSQRESALYPELMMWHIQVAVKQSLSLGQWVKTILALSFASAPVKFMRSFPLYIPCHCHRSFNFQPNLNVWLRIFSVLSTVLAFAIGFSCAIEFKQIKKDFYAFLDYLQHIFAGKSRKRGNR